MRDPQVKVSYIFDLDLRVHMALLERLFNGMNAVLALVDLLVFGPIGGPACFSQRLLVGSLYNPHNRLPVLTLNMVPGLVGHRGH